MLKLKLKIKKHARFESKENRKKGREEISRDCLLASNLTIRQSNQLLNVL